MEIPDHFTCLLRNLYAGQEEIVRAGHGTIDCVQIGKEYVKVVFCYPAYAVFSSIQSLSHVRLFETPWTAACQASLSITNSQSLLKLMSIESVMPSNHLILCHPLILPPSPFPSSGSFPISQFFTWGGQSIRVSAHRLKKSKICERNYNYNYQQKDKHKDLKQDIKITKCGGGE